MTFDIMSTTEDKAARIVELADHYAYLCVSATQALTQGAADDFVSAAETTRGDLLTSARDLAEGLPLTRPVWARDQARC